MQRVDYDVIIAGAGPAGVATAVAALGAEPGLGGRMLVVDRARFPRAKPCGGGLTGHVDAAMEALGLEVRVPSVASPRAMVRYGEFRREVELPRAVRTVRREEFDQDLVVQARERGIEVREGVGVVGCAVEDGGVTVRTTKGALRARALVGADGVASVVRKALGGDGRPIRLFRAEVPDRGWGKDVMLYDFTPMRDGLRGYLWIFPAPGGLLNVGLMHDPHVAMGGGELTRLLGRRLADHGVSLDGGTLRGWPAWGYRSRRRVAGAHLLTVGDAAGIDALTGEGIAVALEQGAIAGRAVVAALGAGDFAFRGYGRELRRASVGRDLWLDGHLANRLYGENWRRWLGCVLHDDVMLDLYAARVAGSVVLADEKWALARALWRHVRFGRARERRIREAEGAPVVAS